MFPDCEETLYVPDFKQSRSTRDPQYDLLYEIPTLEEYLDTAKKAKRVVGIYPELKNPIFVRDLSIWNEVGSTR